MSAGDNGSDRLISACLAAVGGPGPGGRDLAGANISTDPTAKRRHNIVQIFQDSRNADWSQVHDDGLSILREESKDFYALWGVLAPLPVVRGMGFEGVAVGVELCNKFLSDLWDNTWPALPDGLNARGSILSQLVRRWTNFVQKANPTGKDAEAVSRVAKALPDLERLVGEKFTAESRPSFSDLNQLITAMDAKLNPPETLQAAPAEGEAPVAVEAAPAVPGVPGVPMVAAPVANELEATYASAIKLIDRQPVAAIEQLSAVVQRQSTRSGQFRGRVYLGELYLRAGHSKLARQMLSFLDEECEKIKLEDWEPELCGKLWATLYQAMAREEQEGGGASKDVQQKLEDLFARVCRVDAKQAITLKMS